MNLKRKLTAQTNGCQGPVATNGGGELNHETRFFTQRGRICAANTSTACDPISRPDPNQVCEAVPSRPSEGDGLAAVEVPGIASRATTEQPLASSSPSSMSGPRFNHLSDGERVVVAEVIRNAAVAAGVNLSFVFAKSLRGNLTRGNPAATNARRIAWAVLRRHTQLSFPRIAKVWGCDHSSVVIGARTAEQKLKQEIERTVQLCGTAISTNS